MNVITQQLLTGERAIFQHHDTRLEHCTFADGESPVKECSNIELKNCIFKWMYPIWYGEHIKMENCTVFEAGRAGIWYVDDITVNNSTIEAPKCIRRSSHIVLNNVTFPNGAETLWFCDGVTMNNVMAKGDYFAMNSKNLKIDGFHLTGKYSFDGVENVEIHNARMVTKDVFWNSKNVTVYDSTIIGEYLGWNSENLTFVNCTIDSLQGLCRIKNLVLKNCRLLNTTLAFEYCEDIDAQVEGKIDSVFNPGSGIIRADEIGEKILEADKIDPAKTQIITAK